MELKEALTQQQAKQVRLRQMRESVAAELTRLEGELEEVTADVAVLSRLVARYEGGIVPPGAQDGVPALAPEGQADALDWQHLPRMQAVERVLHEASEPVGRPYIHQVLLDRGRDDPPDTIQAALGHLKLKGRATQSGRGLWIPLNRANGADTQGDD